MGRAATRTRCLLQRLAFPGCQHWVGVQFHVARPHSVCAVSSFCTSRIRVSISWWSDAIRSVMAESRVPSISFIVAACWSRRVTSLSTFVSVATTRPRGCPRTPAALHSPLLVPLLLGVQQRGVGLVDEVADSLLALSGSYLSSSPMPSLRMATQPATGEKCRVQRSQRWSPSGGTG